MDVERWVDITFPLPFFRAFSYRLPSSCVREDLIGHRAVVPFGHKLAIGIITGRAAVPVSGGKEVLCLPDEEPMLRADDLAFFMWMSSYYACPLGQVLRVALAPLKGCYTVKLSWKGPSPVQDLPEVCKPFLQALERAGSLTYEQAVEMLPYEKLMVCLKELVACDVIAMCAPNYVQEEEVALSSRYLSAAGSLRLDDLPQAAKTPAQQRLIDVYCRLMEHLDQKWVPVRRLLGEGISAQLMARARKTGLWVCRYVPEDHLPVSYNEGLRALTHYERELIKVLDVVEHWEGRQVASVQAEGDVYEALCTALAIETVQEGKTTIWLVPNLEALTFWQEHLQPVLGDRLMVWSSQQSIEERRRVWHRLQRASAGFILATSSILLCPFVQLDCIMVMEEASMDYKNGSAPRYHARDAAIMCAQQRGAKVILGGAVSSLETYYNLEKGKYVALKLPVRDRAHPPTPALKFVTRPRRHPVLTPPVMERLKRAFSEKKRVVILHPRRGYTAYTACQACGWEATCDACGRGLVYHQGGDLHCHPCHRVYASSSSCPQCKGGQLKYRAIGIQQLEETLTMHFRGLKVGRVDRDETPYQKKYEEVLRAFREGKLDCLVGTQRLVRALIRLTPDLIMWIDPHGWVDQNDFRAPLRQRYVLHQLLRRGCATEVWVLAPERHRDVFKYLRQDPKTFYRELLASCKAHDYPPYVRFVKVVLRHRQASVVQEAAGALMRMLQTKLQLVALGPLPVLSSVEGREEVEIWIKLPQQKAKPALVDAVQRAMKSFKHRQVKVYFDVDPIG